MISCAIGGGKYIRKVSLSLRAVIWVSGTEWLGPLLSHRPSTLAISVPLVEQEYILDGLCTFFIHVLFMVSSKALVTTFCSGLHRWDELLLLCESPPIHLAYLCTPLSYFWHSWMGLAQKRRIPKIWFSSGRCDGLQPSLK